MIVYSCGIIIYKTLEFIQDTNTNNQAKPKVILRMQH